MDADVLYLEMQGPAGLEPRLDEIVHDLVLAVDGDRAAAGERRHVDAMACPVEGEVDAVVPHPLARQPPADAGLAHQVYRPLLEHARAHALDDVLTAAIFEDDGVDAFEMQQLSEHQTGRARADDAYLGAGGHGVF